MLGDLSYKKVSGREREELIKVVDSLKELTIAKACEVLRLNPRRYHRWRKWRQQKPKRIAWNHITPQEEGVIIEAAKDEALCDLRAAGLMVYGHESGKFHCSVSTVQRTLKRNEMQAPYKIPRRKQPVKPDIRQLMNEPRKVFSYDATEFYLINRLRVVVILILDLGSRKFIHYGIRVTSFTQKDVMNIWDETLWKEDIDTSQLTALSDRGGQMKGSRTKAHLIGKWNVRLEFARPYTPDDNAWIEAFIKYMKYHPACPDVFETAQDVAEWIAKFQKLYNNHPHSSLGYVCPNDEHAGLGNVIRRKRKEHLLLAMQKRLAYYQSQREGVSDYEGGEDRGPEDILEPFIKAKNSGNGKEAIIEGLETVAREDDFRANSSPVLCQNR